MDIIGSNFPILIFQWPTILHTALLDNCAVQTHLIRRHLGRSFSGKVLESALCVYLTERVYKVVLQKLILSRIRQLILHASNNEG